MAQHSPRRQSDTDLLFPNPDNGTRPSDHREPRHRNKSVKHEYLDEVQAFLEREPASSCTTTPITPLRCRTKRIGE